MRTIRRNKQALKYALLVSDNAPEYKLDADGNKIVVLVDEDGTEHYLETGKTTLLYGEPVDFSASISFGGTDVDILPFGISSGEYDATIVANLNEFPITETTLIWYKSEVSYKDSAKTIVDPKSADYTVTKVTPSLNGVKYLLKAVTK